MDIGAQAHEKQELPGHPWNQNGGRVTGTKEGCGEVSVPEAFPSSPTVGTSCWRSYLLGDPISQGLCSVLRIRWLRTEHNTDKQETDCFAANIPQQISKNRGASFGSCLTLKSLDKSGRWKEFQSTQKLLCLRHDLTMLGIWAPTSNHS